MPNPKWRHSKQRKRKRRTHDALELPTLGRDVTTSETHVFHRAHYNSDGALFYRGKMVIEAPEKSEVSTAGEDN